MDVSSFVAGLARAQAVVTAAGGDGLIDAAEPVLAEAKAITPGESGELAESGAIAADGLAVAISFGTGESEAYAVIQHEDLSQDHDPGRQGHYLSGPLIARKDTVAQVVAARIQGSL
jgi:hypothetical protein